MQTTSALYKRLLGEEHSVEARLVIGESGILITEDGDGIIFGRNNGQDIRILVEQGGADDGFTEAEIFDMSTYNELFSGTTPTVGQTVAGQIDVTMLDMRVNIPRMAQLIPYIRLVSADGTEHSEWIKKGVYYLDTREVTHNDDGLNVLTLTGFDAMLKAQDDYPSSASVSYPARDTVIVQTIARAMGVDVDERTWDIMTAQYTYGLPAGYSMQEVLSSIATSYVANWIITDEGMLRLVSFADIPKETRLLTDEVGYAIIFGTENGTASGDPVRILV